MEAALHQEAIPVGAHHVVHMITAVALPVVAIHQVIVALHAVVEVLEETPVALAQVAVRQVVEVHVLVAEGSDID